MPRQGLTKGIILEEAVRFINERGYKELTFTVLAAQLIVKPPALFKHYKSLDALKESLTHHGIKKLREKLQDSVTAKSGEQALEALCHAYRNYAKINRGLYQAIQPAYFGRNKEIEQAAMQLMGIIISVLKGFDIADKDLIHPLRIIRSSLHGFVVLEIEFGFGMPGNIDVSFGYLINSIIFMIKSFQPKD
jgi:AcrR family transcriptional regulator